MPRCALNFEEHGVRYAGLDRSAVGSCKYFTALALSKGIGLRFSGHRPSIIPRGFRKKRLFLDNALHPKIDGVARDAHPPSGGYPPGVRFAGLDRSAVGSRKYFIGLALSKRAGLRLSGHSLLLSPCTKLIH